MGRGSSQTQPGDAFIAEGLAAAARIPEWNEESAVNEDDLRNQLRRLLIEIDGKKIKLPLLERRRVQAEASQVTADQLHRILARLFIELEKQKADVDINSVEEMLKARSQQAEYQHHTWFDYKGTTCCRLCGAVRQRHRLLQDLPCKGQVKVGLR